MKIKTNSKDDLLYLSIAINDLSREEKCNFMAATHALGLMRFSSDEEAAKSVGMDKEVLDNFLNNQDNPDVYKLFFFGLEAVAPKEIDEMIQNVRTHIVLGIDTEDEDSVGGWSQREIDMVLEKVNLKL